MLDEFLSYIDVNLSVGREEPILLAISGGIDSMVMADLFIRAKWTVEIAHVNHSTRAGQSDIDAGFVSEYAAQRNVPYHEKILDYDALNKGNFQANARDARYQFFRHICRQNGLQYIATAHHQDDRWETFIMHLNRKSGLTGLTSLPPRSNDVIRPLMGFTKDDILRYASENKLRWHEDASNAETDYLRNKIRNHLTPAIKETFPQIIRHTNTSINHLAASQALIDELITSLEITKPADDNTYLILDVEKVRSFRSSTQLLYAIMSGYNYTYSDVEDMLQTRQTGATFLSSTHETLYDRSRLLIRPHTTIVPIYIYLTHGQSYQTPQGTSVIYGDHDEDIDVCIPLRDGLEGITIRSVQPGDRYRPPNLNSKTKTLKKYMNDRKMNRYQREKQLVIVADDEIIHVLP